MRIRQSMLGTASYITFQLDYGTDNVSSILMHDATNTCSVHSDLAHVLGAFFPYLKRFPHTQIINVLNNYIYDKYRAHLQNYKLGDG